MARFRIPHLNQKRIILGIAVCAILAGLFWLFFLLAGRELCYVAIRQIGEMTNTKIKTESVDFHTDGSVYIRNLVIRPEDEQKQDDTIIEAKTVFARFSLGSLLTFRPRLKAVDVNDFVVNAQYDQDTQKWNISALKIKPPKGGPGRMPQVRLDMGTLQYSKISDGQATVALSVPLNARLGSDGKTENGYSFEITTATMSSGHGQSRLTGTWKPGNLTVTGGISSVDVPDLEMAWIVDVLAADLQYDQNNEFSLKMNIKDLRFKRGPALERLTMIGPSFLETSGPFAALQRFFHQYEPRGQVDIELEASGNLDRLSESSVSGDVYCKDVAVCYNDFPYPLEHLAGRIGFTANSVTLCNLVGQHDDAKLLFNGWCRDFGPNRKYQIQIKSDNMPLDEDLYNALPEKEQKFWRAFSPKGLAAIDYWYTRESQTKKRDKLEVDLRGISAVYEGFPYPLENLNGQLIFEGDSVVFSNVVSKVDERQIAVNGQLSNEATDEPAYDISVNVSNLPLDSMLEAALPEQQKVLYTRSGLAGLADGWVRVTTQDSGPPSFVADLSFKQASLNSEEFPLSVSDISAKAAFTPNLITIKEFSGRHGDGRISLTGQIQPAQQQGHSLYDLVVKMEHTSLNEDLFDLLPDSLKKTVSDIKPEGKVNFTAHLSKDDPAKYPDYDMDLECLSDSVILPDFCYLLEDVNGALTLDANHIELKDVTATLSNNVSIDTKATIKLNGEMALTNGTFDNALLTLIANNVSLDDQFSLLLPQHIRPSYSKLSPSGLFNLDFDGLHVVRTPDGKKSIDFAGKVSLRNCDFNASNPQLHLDATFQTDGLYKTGEGLVSCQAALESGTLMVRGKSFTDLRADFSYDPYSQCWSTYNLIANCYDGKLTGRFQYQEPNEQPGQYILQTGFVGVDLKRFLSDEELDEAPQTEHTSGKMSGSLCINARTGDDTSRLGTCKLSISDMQVGKLSPLAKLFQVVRLTEPQEYAFDRMLVDSYIRRDGLFVRKLDLSGQDIAFSGSGRMDLEKNSVDLTLMARGKRLATDAPSVLQSLTEGLGQAVVRMSVTGDFHDPKVKTETLPVIEQTLQVLGAKSTTRN